MQKCLFRSQNFTFTMRVQTMSTGSSQLGCTTVASPESKRKRKEIGDQIGECNTSYQPAALKDELFQECYLLGENLTLADMKARLRVSNSTAGLAYPFSTPDCTAAQPVGNEGSFLRWTGAVM